MGAASSGSASTAGATTTATDGVVVATKLAPPAPRVAQVRRPRLVARLAERPRLALICAPAGSGKTTLLGEWLAASQVPGTSFAWVSLDPADAEPTRFWTYVITSLRAAAPAVGHESLAMLRAPGTSVREDVIPRLINELAGAPGEVTLVLDDLHAVEDPAILGALGYLVDRLPPSATAVIATRADPDLPLARLRARGELVELRAADLHFDLGEIRAFVNGLLELALSDSDLRLLAERTEGWPAGVRLATLSLAARPDRRAFLAEFAGDDRHLVDYLVAEVLAAQPASARSFLLRTSILDRLCGALCDAVSADSGSEATLAGLERAGLFLVPLDERRQWYRYHHLFREFLTRELERTQPRLGAELHRRAVRWHREAAMPAEAIRHALAAGDHSDAAELIAVSWMPELVVNAGDATIAGWLDGLPEAVVASDVRLCVARIYSSFSLGRIDEARRWLELGERAPQPGPFADGFPSAEAALACARAAYLYGSGDLGAALAEARRAQPLVAGAPCEGMAVGATAVALLWSGPADEAEAACRRYAEIGAATGDHAGHVHGFGGAALVRARRGDGASAFALADESMRLAGVFAIGEHWVCAAAHLACAEVHLRRDDPVAAEPYLERALGLSRRGAGPAALAATLVRLAELRRERGDPAAPGLVAEARGIAAGCPDPGLVRDLLRRWDGTLSKRARASDELTGREREVLRELATTAAEREIAARLHLSRNTVKTHRAAIFRKLGVNDRAAAVTAGRARGLI